MKAQEEKVRPDEVVPALQDGSAPLKVRWKKFYSEVGIIYHINLKQDITLGKVQPHYTAHS